MLPDLVVIVVDWIMSGHPVFCCPLMLSPKSQHLLLLVEGSSEANSHAPGWVQP